MQNRTHGQAAEGGIIVSPTWPDGCPLTVAELAHPDHAHIDCARA